MRRVKYDGLAKQAGDVYQDDLGVWHEVVSCTGAHEVLAEQSERDRLLRTPNFNRHSIAGLCVAFGDTSCREKRDIERRKAAALKVLRPQRS